MAAEGGTPGELELARARLARSRARLHRAFTPSQGGGGLPPLLRGLAARGVHALASSPGGAGSGLRLALGVATLVTMLFARKRTRRRGFGIKGRSLGLALPLLFALIRFARRR